MSELLDQLDDEMEPPVVTFTDVDGVTHTFATEVEMLNFVGSRRIGLYAPQPLNDAQWESYARG